MRAGTTARRAALRLTVAYALIQLAAYAVVAVSLYAFVTGTVDRSAVGGAAAPETSSAGFARLRSGLLLSLPVQLVLATALGHLMARRALRPVRADLEAQQRFLDNAAHEFRTPLSVLQSDIELTLSRPRSGPEYVHALEDALVDVSGLTALTTDLLVLARGTSDHDGLPVQSVSLLSVATTARDRALHACTDAAPIGIQASHDVHVPGSPELLARAVGNLLDNALHHTPPTGTVTVVLAQDATTASVRVIDDGTGMTPAARRRAFDRLWRDTASSTYPGHGLGLALVAQIAAAHHGRAEISPTPGGGTTVTLTLPL